MRNSSRLLTSIVLVLLACAIGYAQGGRDWTISPSASGEKSPLSPTPDVLKKGKAVFTSHCQKCHGPEGKGDGPDGDRD